MLPQHPILAARLSGDSFPGLLRRHQKDLQWRLQEVLHVGLGLQRRDVAAAVENQTRLEIAIRRDADFPLGLCARGSWRRGDAAALHESSATPPPAPSGTSTSARSHGQGDDEARAPIATQAPRADRGTDHRNNAEQRPGLQVRDAASTQRGNVNAAADHEQTPTMPTPARATQAMLRVNIQRGR